MAVAQDIILLILGAAIGFLIAWYYFRNLRWSARRHALELEWKARLEKLSSKYRLGIEKLTGKFKLAQEKRSKEHEVSLEKLTKEWQLRYIQDIEELKKLFKENEKVIRQKSVSASRRSLVGKFVEKFVPFLAGIKYAPADMHFLGQPIDYIVFEGAHEDDIKKVTFLEVKTGDGVLTKRERSLRDAIKKRKVAWKEVRVDTSAKKTPDKEIAAEKSSISDLYKNIDHKLTVARAGTSSALKAENVKAGDGRAGYTLEMGASGKTIDAPSDKDIMDAISALQGQEDDFVILGRSDDENVYMQCAGGPEDFTLEYQDGSEENHCSADASQGTVIAAFISFASGDDRWRELCRCQDDRM